MKVDEVFVPVVGFEEYSVSNYGRVIDNETDEELEHCVVDNRNVLKPRVYVYIPDFGAVWLDTLITEAFFVDYHEGIDIYYKNGDHLDCTVLNLTFIKPKD